MDFVAVVDQVIALLRQRGRVTYRLLKRQFQLDDEALEDLKIELIDGQRLATDEQGTVLVWTGEAAALPAVAAAPAPAAAPLGYTPPYLAEKILTSRRALEGERKQVTVLFADLKGSTELIRDLDPEAAQRLLDPALQRMMDAVHRFEGTVNQVLGDGIMALFGAPVAHEDHAARACYAALAMQDALHRYAEEVRRRDGLAVQIRVGLNSGDVVVRAIGNDLHMDYSAVGLTTVLAARMEQLATPGSTLLTAATLRLVEGLVQVNPLGPVPVKGPGRARWRSSSWWGPAPSAGACRRPSHAGSPALWDGSQSWQRCTRHWSGRGRARAGGGAPRRGGCGQVAPGLRVWCTPTAPRAGWCWRVPRCPTARRRRTSRCSTC